MLLSRAALRADASGEPMTNGLGKKGKRRGWSAKDTRTLKSLAQKKTPARQIARELGRTEGAVRQKAMAVGTSLSTRKRARRK
jgi:hypothetical protein